MPITVITVWRTQKDTKVCSTCKALEGYTWTFDAGDPYPKQLVHPLYGPVYDMRPATHGSLVKEEKGHICRCRLEHQFEVSTNLPDDKCLAKTIVK
jgi:hypothetical protein